MDSYHVDRMAQRIKELEEEVNQHKRTCQAAEAALAAMEADRDAWIQRASLRLVWGNDQLTGRREAEAERDALWVLAQLEIQAYEEMVAERVASEEELCDCKLCQAVRGLPPALRARLAQEAL